MRVLVACEFSGIVRDAFIARGHDAVSCDLLPTERPGPHVEGDVRPMLREPWDLVIAHPPCTYLCNVSSIAYSRDPWRRRDMARAVNFFYACWCANAPRIAVENPLPMARAQDLLPPGPQQYVHPWEHGHAFTKRTGLWLRGLPPLMASEPVQPTHVWMQSGSRGKHTPWQTGNGGKRTRSHTFQGIADAMAEQWGTA